MLQYSSHEAVYLETRSLEDWESKKHNDFYCVVLILPTPLDSACSCRLKKSRDSAVTQLSRYLSAMLSRSWMSDAIRSGKVNLFL